jgi:hypothetical protein
VRSYGTATGTSPEEKLKMALKGLDKLEEIVYI